MSPLRRLARLLILVPAFAGTTSVTPPLTTLSVPGAPVELTCRAFQPGEAILAALKDDLTVKRVVLRFLGQTRSLASTGTEVLPRALLGIDLAAKPGAYPLEVKVERPDGSSESFSLDLKVDPKEFPKLRLRVAPSLLVPPPEERERVRREQELVTAVLSIVSPDWLADGPFVSPLAAYEPFPNFGQQRIYNRTVASTHTGVDIGAPWGTPVRAANAGRVVMASHLYLSGYTVIIDHGLGVFTSYGHFSKLLAERGDLVNRGDIIARVGNTGRSTGPHLHWSVRIGPNRVDPFSLVSLPLN
jgi:murein DD-endopeptidase MepM/ murein hydrolase activator NlpD